jgi:hypothetical protein
MTRLDGPRFGRILIDASIRDAPDQAALRSPSCCRAVTPSSRPISSRIFPFLSFNTVVPLKCIFRSVAAGNDPMRKSLKAGPVCVPPLPSEKSVFAVCRKPVDKLYSATLTCLLSVFFFFFFPALGCFASAVFQLASSSSSGFFGVLRYFVSSFANLECRRIPVALLSFTLSISLLFGGMGARTNR